jgi:nucleoside-diphosphate-sugar epimerase
MKAVVTGEYGFIGSHLVDRVLIEVRKRYTGRRSWIGDNPIVDLSLDRIERLGWKPSDEQQDGH